LTGPRTAEGKAKVRFNALTHGLTAATVVLPHEDAQAYQHRLEAWTAELQAAGDLGRYLVERVVKISWQLDRADTFEQAHLARRIQDAPRLFAASRAQAAETLFARLIGTAAEPAVHEPGGARGPRRAGSGPVNSLAVLLCELGSSSQGCRRLMAEWTRLMESLGRLGPEGFATSGIRSKLDNLHRALRRLGVRVGDTAAVTAATADPLPAPLLQAWHNAKGQAIAELRRQEADEMLEFMQDDDDDHPPDEPEPAPKLTEPYWWGGGHRAHEARHGATRASENPASQVRAERGGGTCQAGF
jgi:hypothetical protein